MKRFDASKVRMSTHLVPTPDRTKAAKRQEYKKAVEIAFAVEPFDGSKKAKKYAEATPLKAGFIPRQKKHSGCTLNPAIREHLRTQLAARSEAREAFFAAIKSA